uniref:Uncharacterized protein n=1 Tax=Cacopsylla melanoneura TaxID=428564 RepID=A0A8D8T325_9HEMI
MDPSEKITSSIEIENILLSESFGKSEDNDEQGIDTSQDDEEIQNGENIVEEIQVSEKDCKTPDKSIQNKLSVEDQDEKSSSCKRRLFKSDSQNGIKKSKKNIFKNGFKKINYSSNEDEDEFAVSVKTLSEIKRNGLNPYVSLTKSDVKRKRLAKDLEDDFNAINEDLRKTKKSKFNNPDSDEEEISKENTPVKIEATQKQFNTSDIECTDEDKKQNRSDENDASGDEETPDNKTAKAKKKMNKKKVLKVMEHVKNLEKKNKKKKECEMDINSDEEDHEKRDDESKTERNGKLCSENEKEKIVLKKKHKSKISKLKKKVNESDDESKTESENEKKEIVLKKKQKSSNSKLKNVKRNDSEDEFKEETGNEERGSEKGNIESDDEFKEETGDRKSTTYELQSPYVRSYAGFCLKKKKKKIIPKKIFLYKKKKILNLFFFF